MEHVPRLMVLSIILKWKCSHWKLEEGVLGRVEEAFRNQEMKKKLAIVGNKTLFEIYYSPKMRIERVKKKVVDGQCQQENRS